MYKWCLSGQRRITIRASSCVGGWPLGKALVVAEMSVCLIGVVGVVQLELGEKTVI